MNMLGRMCVNSPRMQCYDGNVTRVRLPGRLSGILENNTVSVLPAVINRNGPF
jgi:hypothetical protein